MNTPRKPWNKLTTKEKAMNIFIGFTIVLCLLISACSLIY